MADIYHRDIIAMLQVPQDAAHHRAADLGHGVGGHATCAWLLSLCLCAHSQSLFPGVATRAFLDGGIRTGPTSVAMLQNSQHRGCPCAWFAVLKKARKQCKQQ